MTDTKLKRYPVRGALYGFLLGVATAYFAFFQFALFGFDTLTGVVTKFAIIILAGMVLGMVWAYVAPPRRAKRPAGEAPPPPAADAA